MHVEPCRFATDFSPDLDKCPRFARDYEARGMKLLKSSLGRKSTFKLGSLKTNIHDSDLEDEKTALLAKV